MKIMNALAIMSEYEDISNGKILDNIFDVLYNSVAVAVHVSHHSTTHTAWDGSNDALVYLVTLIDSTSYNWSGEQQDAKMVVEMIACQTYSFYTEKRSHYSSSRLFSYTVKYHLTPVLFMAICHSRF